MVLNGYHLVITLCYSMIQWTSMIYMILLLVPLLKLIERQRNLMNRDPRRAQERYDFHMVQEDHNAVANLSATPINHEWPKWRAYPGSFYDNVVYRKVGCDSYKKYKDISK